MAENNHFVTVDTAIAVLNRALEADPKVISDLVAARLPCNEALADDPTVQCGEWGGVPLTVGLLGIINGIFGADERGTGYICAVYDNEDDELIARFQRTPAST